MTSFSPPRPDLPRPDLSAARPAARVAVLLPCYNEAAAIGQTVAAFRAALPDAAIYVYDNNSSDGTTAVAAAAGATVRVERMQGKGHVVRRMFADIDADIYVLADGDATYDAAAAPAMIARLADERLDMVVGARQSEVQAAYRRGHRLGNRLLTGCVAWIFGRSFSDILSGYRVFSRRFVKSFPVLAQGFEIETDITVHALELRLPVAEVMTAYAARPAGSASKLSTWRDGWRILTMILNLARTEKPVTFFGLFAALFLATALGLSVDLVATYLATGLVPRLPTAVLAMGLTLVALLALVCGLILDTVTRGRREIKRLAYLAQPAPGAGNDGAPPA
ncbi:glycosyltransferase [Sphingomonas changnyeongensis]|uniref:Glycosyltransferase n=1 Tax=Sphingomonas changnyeongensis TaxID=2698679 RepID=A0A7Z2S4U4_9SPHN|nr:glycosyltransferase [Sphingomonas changnyeongensis]QHL90420.1 glycosyltransferase [Sphingomonas changnyeongensis]